MAGKPANMKANIMNTKTLIAGALAYTLTAGKRYSAQRRAASDLNSLLHDNLDGIRQIKGYARETAEHSRFNTASEKLRQATLVVMRAWDETDVRLKGLENFLERLAEIAKG